MLYALAQILLTVLLMGIGIEAKRIVLKNDELKSENISLKARLK